MSGCLLNAKMHIFRHFLRWPPLLFSFFYYSVGPTSLTGPFLSAGKGDLRYLVPKWLFFLNPMWGVVFAACVGFHYRARNGQPNDFCSLERISPCVFSSSMWEHNLAKAPYFMSKYFSHTNKSEIVVVAAWAFNTTLVIHQNQSYLQRWSWPRSVHKTLGI